MVRSLWTSSNGMISSQRTYEMNAKGVQTSDEMMQGANQLKQ